jgi:hypothetical protein
MARLMATASDGVKSLRRKILRFVSGQRLDIDRCDDSLGTAKRFTTSMGHDLSPQRPHANIDLMGTPQRRVTWCGCR